MATRLMSVVVDSTDIRAQAEFWSTLLTWPLTHIDADEADVESPELPLELVFVPVHDPKTTKNRIHLDLSSTGDQSDIVARAIDLGARPVDIGQRDVPWVVLADPEGNEFCVLEQRPEYTGIGSLAAIVVDSPDPATAADFWHEATGWTIARREDILASLRHPDARGPWLEFIRAGDKQVKNRVHLDVAPFTGDSLDAEVDRLCALGARRVDIGQRDVPWVVLADPHDGEFCVLTPR